MQTRFSLMEICLETEIQFVNLLVEYLRLSLTALVCVGFFLWFFLEGCSPAPKKRVAAGQVYLILPFLKQIELFFCKSGLHWLQMFL